MVQDATTILRASLNHVPSSHILQVIACRHRAPQSDQCSPLRRNTARQGHAISIPAPLPRSAALRPPRCSDLHVLSHARRKAVRLHRSWQAASFTCNRPPHCTTAPQHRCQPIYMWPGHELCVLVRSLLSSLLRSLLHLHAPLQCARISALTSTCYHKRAAKQCACIALDKLPRSRATAPLHHCTTATLPTYIWPGHELCVPAPLPRSAPTLRCHAPASLLLTSTCYHKRAAKQCACIALDKLPRSRATAPLHHCTTATLPTYIWLGHELCVPAPLPRSAPTLRSHAQLPRCAAKRPHLCSNLHVLSQARRKAVRLHRSWQAASFTCNRPTASLHHSNAANLYMTRPRALRPCSAPTLRSHAQLPRCAATRPHLCSDLHVLSQARRKAVRMHRFWQAASFTCNRPTALLQHSNAANPICDQATSCASLQLRSLRCHAAASLLWPPRAITSAPQSSALASLLQAASFICNRPTASLQHRIAVDTTRARVLLSFSRVLLAYSSTRRTHKCA